MTSIKNEGNRIAGYLATAMEWSLSVLEAGIAPDDHQVLNDVEDMGDHRNKDTFTSFMFMFFLTVSSSKGTH